MILSRNSSRDELGAGFDVVYYGHRNPRYLEVRSLADDIVADALFVVTIEFELIVERMN
jgi:hypothetical protein